MDTLLLTGERVLVFGDDLMSLCEPGLQEEAVVRHTHRHLAVDTNDRMT